MKTKISEKTLEMTPKLDFERSNVDFSSGFAGPCVALYSPPKGPTDPL